LILVVFGLLGFAAALLALYTDQPMGVFSMFLGVGLGTTLAANVMRWAA